MTELTKLRIAIDEIDRKLVQGLTSRLERLALIAEIKKKNNLMAHDPQRELEMIEKVRRDLPDSLVGNRSKNFLSKC